MPGVGFELFDDAIFRIAFQGALNPLASTVAEEQEQLVKVAAAHSSINNRSSEASSVERDGENVESIVCLRICMEP